MQKQTKLGSLLSEQERFDERRLASSFVEMAGALPCRPEPRHLFDNAASPGRIAYRGLPIFIGGSAVMREAFRLGNPALIDECARRVKAHLSDIADVILRDYYALVDGELSLDEARSRASKETHEALHAILEWTMTGTDSSPRTVKEIDEAIQWLVNLRGRMVAAERPVNDRPRLVRA